MVRTTLRQLDILAFLEETNQATVGQLAEALGMKREAVFGSLNSLRRSGLAQSDPCSRAHRWSVTGEGLAWLRRGEVAFPDLELLDGLLLSDGSLGRPRDCYWPSYQQTSSQRSFLEWCQQLLPTPTTITGPHTARVEGKDYSYWLLRSGTHPCYEKLWQRWYGQGRKAIPEDFAVSKRSMLTAYLGDGSSGRTTKSVSIALYAYPHQESEERVARPLRELGFTCRVSRVGVLLFNAASMQDFLDFLGLCPVPVYDYKWRLCTHW